MANTESPKSLDFEIVRRLTRLPIVSSGIKISTSMYSKVKMSSAIIAYGLNNVEKTAMNVVDLSMPFVNKFEDPINKIDKFMCKSLDIIEENVPMVNYSPEEIYYTTGSLIKAKVDPMLKRANYEKQLVMLEDALSVADMYVNKYLPDVDGDEDYEPTGTFEQRPFSQIGDIIRHVKQLVKKLQKRLTRRMIAEAELLKEQGRNTVQLVLHYADLLVTNPKTFVQETKAIWERLSMEGPQDLQEPPETVHQLIEILFDEGIRRFVRATNSVVRNVHEVAACAKHVIGYIVVMADKRFKYPYLNKMKRDVVNAINAQLVKFLKVLDDLINLRYFLWLISIINKSNDKEAEQGGRKKTAWKSKKVQKKSSARVTSSQK